MKKDFKPLNLLWTGGWDSTFQLIQLVSRGIRVQPYYLIHLNRKSLQNELASMTIVKQLIFERFPNSKDLVLPTVFQIVSEIEIDPEIEAAFLEFKTVRNIGEQYLWLASYCKKEGIDGMMLSVERSEKPDPKLWDHGLKDKLTLDHSNQNLGYRMNHAYRNTKEYNLFKSFYFPLLDKSKRDMYAIAEEEGWLHILDKTWFCLFPTRNNKACGLCKPCQQYIEEGMAYRFSNLTLFLNKYTNRIQNPAKKVVKQMIYSLSFGLLLAEKVNNS